MAGVIKISRAANDMWKVGGAWRFSASDDDGLLVIDVSDAAWEATCLPDRDPIGRLESRLFEGKSQWEYGNPEYPRFLRFYS